MPKTHNQWFGTASEDRAVFFLTKIGYQILDRNYRHGRGEIDIIAQDGETVVFVEVKSRSTRKFEHPSLAVNYRKLKQIAKTGVHYLQEKQLPNPFRIDIISILPGDIEHYQNVTW